MLGAYVQLQVDDAYMYSRCKSVCDKRVLLIDILNRWQAPITSQLLPLTLSESSL